MIPLVCAAAVITMAAVTAVITMASTGTGSGSSGAASDASAKGGIFGTGDGSGVATTGGAALEMSVALLNGTQAASSRAPASVTWTSIATSEHILVVQPIF